jgi:hypothetical protein
MRDHLKQAAPRRMIFPVGLKVLRQMLDPAGEKCDLHIRAAGIFLVQLEVLKVHRSVVLCHNEGATVGEDWLLSTAHLFAPCRIGATWNQLCFAFAVVPEMQFDA